jgi:sortase (surface protein transpeptidase)
MHVTGDGELRTPPVKLARASFYGYRERLVGTSVVTAETPCAPEVETSLAVPAIVTGGRAAGAANAVAAGRVRIASLGVDAPLAPSTIDVHHGLLAVPKDIDRVGWWRDGAAPGAAHGAVLVAGHVDSAAGGAGAFFRLARVRPGALVRVTLSGRTVAYRVASVRSYRKAALPAGVFDRSGRPRLVLVTCGGPFDEATGHYRDVVVVTAYPSRP